jgi:hypothetical protein
MIASSFCLKAWNGKIRGVSEMLTDGDLHAPTIRLEGELVSRAVGLSGITAGDTRAEWIGLVFERSYAGEFSYIDAWVAGRRTAAGAGELARLPRPAIDLAVLMLRWRTR